MIGGKSEEGGDYRDVYFFSYDWRKSSDENAGLLEGFIDSLGAEKVDLVCHSMGGLVASNYYKNYNGAEKINKIITCGTPYERAPVLINKVQNWDLLDVTSEDKFFNDNAIGLAGLLSKKVKSSFKSVSELIPTSNYITSIKMYQDGFIYSHPTSYELTYENYIAMCKRVFKPEAVDQATAFQEGLKDSSGYNVLLNAEIAYFILGVNKPTISSIVFRGWDADILGTLHESDLKYEILGDGTVPYISSSMMEQIRELDRTRWVEFEASHSGVISNISLDWIVNVLKGEPNDVTGTEPDRRGHVVVRIACPVDVKVSSNGETISSGPDELEVTSSFGRLDILGMEDKIKIMCLEETEDYQVEIQGYDSGTMDYSIRYYDEEGQLTDERSVSGIPITKESRITTEISPEQDSTLQIDIDGDGEPDQNVTLTNNVKTTPNLVITGIEGSSISILDERGVKFAMVHGVDTQRFYLVPGNTYFIKWTLEGGNGFLAQYNGEVFSPSSDQILMIMPEEGETCEFKLTEVSN